MSRHTITINLDHHGATKALPRLLDFLRLLAKGYGITSMTFTVREDTPMDIITEDEFDQRFKPIESPGQECGSHLWERHEVMAAIKAGTITEQQVWTYVDADGGYGILPGFHVVNKIEYMVTEVPADENVTVDIPEEDDLDDQLADVYAQIDKTDRDTPEFDALHKQADDIRQAIHDRDN